MAAEAYGLVVTAIEIIKSIYDKVQEELKDLRAAQRKLERLRGSLAVVADLQLNPQVGPLLTASLAQYTRALKDLVVSLYITELNFRQLGARAVLALFTQGRCVIFRLLTRRQEESLGSSTRDWTRSFLTSNFFSPWPWLATRLLIPRNGMLWMTSRR